MNAKDEHNIISGDVNELNKANSNHIISLWLDSYDDIFSDFDPRAYSERNISDDFLDEVKKVSIESDFIISEIKLLIPSKVRQQDAETVITKRLHSYFIKNQHYFFKKKMTERKRGLLFIMVGVFMMTIASMVSSFRSGNILMHTLLMVFEPAGWFLVWSGMETLINSSRKEKPELDFYNKIMKSKIVFYDIK